MKAVCWGTYDIGKPRTRILLKGLRENGVEVVECRADVWRGVDDKSQVSGIGRKIALAARWFLSYPSLIYRYLRLPAHDAAIVAYLGHLDVLMLWPFAKLRGVPIVWDAFLSLYNTVIEDRKIFGARHPAALLLYCWEWLACRAANIVLLDTKAHADYFVERFGLDADRVGVFYVGAEVEKFDYGAGPRHEATGNASPAENLTILFYGQFIPLHGVGTIIEAARVMENEEVDWIIIGKGQEAPRVRRMLDEHELPRVSWLPWVEYEKLIEHIRRADICLGIFGDTDKAARVIPNKVFQVVAAGRPLITRDSPAIRELFPESTPGLYLVRPADPGGIVTAIEQFRAERRQFESSELFPEVRRRITPEAIGRQVVSLIERTVQRKQTRVGGDEP